VILVRNARLADAPAMSAVLVSSITELCGADHHNDPQALANWLANKTPESVASWFGNAANTFVVAEHKGEIAAVGAFNVSREITLNYVAPAHRYAGVSTALLEAMELGLGTGEATLNSTETARQFYRSRGWKVADDPALHGGISCQRMRKLLV
jgi:N-acetylglutamate synthase-like GNAT family acetyltransferase